MHLLVCQSCGRRYVVTGACSLEEWVCTKCSQELTVINGDVERLAVMGDVLPPPVAAHPSPRLRRLSRPFHSGR